MMTIILVVAEESGAHLRTKFQIDFIIIKRKIIKQTKVKGSKNSKKSIFYS